MRVRALGLGAGLMLASAAPATPTDDPERPNVVIILADDLGFGATGVYGQTARAAAGLPHTPTPSIDALAEAGMRFTGMYASASVCSPSRCGLMTAFHCGHATVDRNGLAPLSLLEEETTIAEVLHAAGYRTGLFGKWGLGGTTESTNDPFVDHPPALPTRHGFERIFGYLNQVRAHDYLVPSLWRDDPAAPNGVGLIPTGGVYSHDVITDQALAFIAESVADGLPFYLQASFTIPHWYYHQVPGWTDFGEEDWPDVGRMLAAMMQRLDGSVGSILERLADPNGDGDPVDGVLERTVIIFTSDNGSDDVFFEQNGPLRGGKAELYEGGIRVPFIVRWDGVIGQGLLETEHLGSLEDVLPTIAAIAGAAAPVGIDGVSLLPTLLGLGHQEQRSWLVWEHHNGTGHAPRWAVRDNDWKLIRFDDATSELYDLATDPAEATDLVEERPDVRDMLEQLALAEMVDAPVGYRVQYRRWDPSSVDDTWANPSRWIEPGVPAPNWIVRLDNTVGEFRTARVGSPVEVLGFEVVGTSGAMEVAVDEDAVLLARNGGRLSASGILSLDQGVLRAGRRVHVARGGMLRGNGQVEGSVLNEGIVAPTGNDAPIGISGELVLGPGASVHVTVGGREAADEPGSLLIQGDAWLDGALVVEILDSFHPTAGTPVALVSGPHLHGQFTEVTLVGRSPQCTDLDIRVVHAPTSVSLEIGPSCRCDITGDGVIDVDDLVTVILSWGTDGSKHGGDLDGSGVVDVDDLLSLILGWGPCGSS